MSGCQRAKTRQDARASSKARRSTRYRTLDGRLFELAPFIRLSHQLGAVVVSPQAVIVVADGVNTHGDNYGAWCHVTKVAGATIYEPTAAALAELDREVGGAK